MSTKYISTRGGGTPLGFTDVMMTGLARDGGLFLPFNIPCVRDKLAVWKTLPYRELALEIMRLYTDIPEHDLKMLIDHSYSSFRHREVTPVVSPDGELYILELFHGPTLAFKDVALQLLGNIFEYVLARQSRKLNLLVATSGDTGGAAIHGIKGRKDMKIFVLYPNGGISPAQERQMTTVQDENVFCIAVNGSFDDCQGMVKEVLNDLDFRDRFMLGAVNSINWARLLAQVVYYFYAAFRVMEKRDVAQVRFSVPTGNFGDIFAGYIAAQMGLPISLLILASNENDILPRFFNTGIYERGSVRKTISPSMDIQVASNFERYLYYLVGRNPAVVRDLMCGFSGTGRLEIKMPASGQLDPLFAAGSCDTESALSVMRDLYRATGYLLDPHSAVGVHVARMFPDPHRPVICLATAHPAKFGETVQRATGSKKAGRHEILDKLASLPVRREVMPASVEAVQDFIARHS